MLLKALFVVVAGPWHVAGKLLILKPWAPQMVLTKEKLRTIPIWVQFSNIPLEFWIEQGLSYIASAIGKPPHADDLAEKGQRLTFANIYVEVNVDSPFLEVVEVEYANGLSAFINVRYPWKPSRCSECHVFGHTVASHKDKVAVNGDPTKLESNPIVVEQAVIAPIGFVLNDSSSLRVIPRGSNNSTGANVGPSPVKVLGLSSPTHIQVCDSAGIDKIVQTYASETVSPKVSISSKVFGKGSLEVSRLPSKSDLGDIGVVISTSGNKFYPLAENCLELDGGVSSLHAVGVSYSGCGSVLPTPVREGVVTKDPFLGRVASLPAPKDGKAKAKGRGREAKIRPENMSPSTGHCFLVHWHHVHNLGSLPAARIIVGWDPSLLSVSLVFSSVQIIFLSVEIHTEHKSFFVSMVYGLNYARERISLWNELRMLSSSLGGFAWVIMGDFNVVRTPAERFTWTDKRGGIGDNKIRLDRVAINEGWMELFTDSEVVGHPPGISDHYTLVMTMVHNKFKAYPFRFFNFWMADDRVCGLIDSSWNKDVCGDPMLRHSSKIRRLKLVLKAFHKEHYGNLSGRVEIARSNLVKIQNLCFQFSHDVTLCELEKDLGQQFYAPSSIEEVFKKQKSRVQWLALGDKNTKFFHQKMHAHRVKNNILSLVNDQGVRLEDPVAIEEEILGYYQRLLGSDFMYK
ncbi:uncharacterized protein LOC131302927 [Rhododendron vialii]|uniref:uncharacterized protein LOC131302927 n=1 Tax=Rhododendron vialii TaxID=182163 RepID=UPI00265E4659|nr:uncharacterized protein LOC131302927 [Rhododendron vialii]